jgi:hypothetical protein
MCYEETSEEIALQNGAKNYKNRADLLNESRMHNKLEQRSFANINNLIYYYDLCGETIKNNYYSNGNKEHSYDICINCYETNNNVTNLIEEKNMTFVDINNKSYSFELTDFRSMLYWLPVIGDNEDCRVLINFNPNDKNYGQICLQSCDDHGRYGYFIIKDETYDLDMILKKLKEICDTELCSTDYTSPIQILMESLNMPVYYG